MFRKRTINVRNGFAKEVRFEVDFYKEDKVAEIEEVLKNWTQVTGLNFSSMPCEDHSGDVAQGNEGLRFIIVEHPLDNRSKTVFCWNV